MQVIEGFRDSTTREKSYEIRIKFQCRHDNIGVAETQMFLLKFYILTYYLGIRKAFRTPHFSQICFRAHCMSHTTER